MKPQKRALSRSEVDLLVAELVAFEAKADAKRAELLRHWREGARKDQTWTLRGHAWDILLTRASKVYLRDQLKAKKLPVWIRRAWLVSLLAPNESAKEARRNGPKKFGLPKRLIALLKLSRYWQVKPERRKS